MAERSVSYVCVRADHHRRQSRAFSLTRHKECCAFCPAAAAEGHEWLAVPEVTLETLEALGWIPSGSARRCAERAADVAERASAVADGSHVTEGELVTAGR